MNGTFLEDVSTEGVVEAPVEETKTQLKPPRKYKVFLLNDDYTPMEFVVEVLKIYFFMDEKMATGIMLQVHTQGKGICGVFTREIAETKVALVNDYAYGHQHPLLCRMEPE